MKYPRKLKTVHIVMIIVLVIIALITFRYFNPNVGFAYFEPTYLPQGILIKQKRIVIDNGKYMQINQNFRTEDWVYSIDEFGSVSSIGNAVQNFDSKSTTPTCDIRTSPQHMRYRVCHWIDYDRIGVYEVKFIKSNTYVQSMIPTTRDRIISLQEIDTYVDSFKRKSTFGLPVLRLEGLGHLPLYETYGKQTWF